MYFSYSLIDNLLFYIIIVQIYLDFCLEKVEDTKALIRNRKSKMDRQYNSQKKIRTKEQPMTYKPLHRKLKTEQYEPQ